MLDTEFMTDDGVTTVLEQLAGETILFGVRLSMDRKAIIERLRERFIANHDLVVFSYHDAADLSEFRFDEPAVKFFIETTDINITADFDRIRPHGLLLKGNEAPGRVSAYTTFVLMQWDLENSDFPVFVHGGVGWHTAPGFFAAGVSGVCARRPALSGQRGAGRRQL